MPSGLEINIAGRPIGPAHAPFIIAEMSGNHNGELARALAIINAIAASGADAVKLQTYDADMLTIDHDGKDFQIGEGLWAGDTLYKLYQKAYTPLEWHESLFAHARKLGLIVFSSPFAAEAVDLLEKLDAPAYKIASFEMIDHALVARAARTGKPLIMSTGLANEAEICEAVAVARAAGCAELMLMHCVSAYPTPIEQCNLRTIPVLAERFGTLVGFSDHTPGIAASVAAIALGAVSIEKHVCLKREDGGVDAAFSIEPDELTDLRTSAEIAWQALGAPTFARQPAEEHNLKFRRSLYIVADVAAGETLTEKHVRSIRPGYGAAPKHIARVLGRRALRPLKRGTALTEAIIARDVEGGA